MGEKTFISYSRVDGAFALRLTRDLRAAGVDVWLDQLDIRTGDTWDRAVEEALSECGAVLLVLSPDAVASRPVMDEVSFALDENKRVIPVLHRACRVPFRLRRIQYIDFTSDYDGGLSRLTSSLGGAPPAADAPPRRAEEAPAPVPGAAPPTPEESRTPGPGPDEREPAPHRPRLGTTVAAGLGGAVVFLLLGLGSGILRTAFALVAGALSGAVVGVAVARARGASAPTPGGSPSPRQGREASSWTSRHPRLGTALRLGLAGGLAAGIAGFSHYGTVTDAALAASFGAALWAAAGAVAGPRRLPLWCAAAAALVAGPLLTAVTPETGLSEGLAVFAPAGAILGALAGSAVARRREPAAAPEP